MRELPATCQKLAMAHGTMWRTSSKIAWLTCKRSSRASKCPGHLPRKWGCAIHGAATARRLHRSLSARRLEQCLRQRISLPEAEAAMVAALTFSSCRLGTRGRPLRSLARRPLTTLPPRPRSRRSRLHAAVPGHPPRLHVTRSIRQRGARRGSCWETTARMPQSAAEGSPSRFGNELFETSTLRLTASWHGPGTILAHRRQSHTRAPDKTTRSLPSPPPTTTSP
mmetsp:Transcript_25458/g.58705  ORF Transcript_25458/g.58705 Transcript_25458/m.58705 type:complete len:224 (-) Transcript_25458:381-1052(-)